MCECFQHHGQQHTGSSGTEPGNFTHQEDNKYEASMVLKAYYIKTRLMPEVYIKSGNSKSRGELLDSTEIWLISARAACFCSHMFLISFHHPNEQSQWNSAKKKQLSFLHILDLTDLFVFLFLIVTNLSVLFLCMLTSFLNKSCQPEF